MYFAGVLEKVLKASSGEQTRGSPCRLKLVFSKTPMLDNFLYSDNSFAYFESELAIIRNKFVDQSQSMNVYHRDAKYSKISSALVFAWKNGLKTGAYYTRTESKLGKNKKLSASDNAKVNAVKKPENSMFTCAGGGCDA